MVKGENNILKNTNGCLDEELVDSMDWENFINQTRYF